INSLSIYSMCLAEPCVFTISLKRAKVRIVWNESRRTIVPAIVAVRKFVIRQTESVCMRGSAQTTTGVLCLGALRMDACSYYKLFRLKGHHHAISILVQTANGSSLQINNPTI